MRFCMVTTFYPPYSFGGDATYVRSLSRGLVERGHEVTVIACRDAFDLLRGDRSRNPPGGDESGADGVTVHWLRSPLGPLSPLLTQQTGRPMLKARPLSRLLAEPFDVINFHNISLVGGPAVLGLGQATARVYTLHEHWLVCPTHIFWKNRERACDGPECIRCCIRSGIPPQVWRYTGLRGRNLAHVDLLLSPSAFTAEAHRRGGVTQPIQVLPLFSALDPPEDSAVSAPARPTFLFVGRVTASKGVEMLTRVVATLPHIDLEVVGDGDLLGELRARHRGDGNIRFLGRLPQDELIAHYRQATAVVVPSIAPETFGLTIVEAAACGTPAIVAKGSGGSEEVVAQTGGIVFDGENGLATALRDLSGDPARAQALGAQARASYHRHYTRTGHIDRYLHSIDTVIAARQTAGGQR